MKRFNIKTTFEEDEEERWAFFESLSYSEWLRYYFKLRNMLKFDKKEYPKDKIFIIHRSQHGI